MASQNIRQLADEAVDRARLSAAMEVHMWFDQSEPPVGRLTVISELGAQERVHRTIPFIGWLGLLRALSDAIDSPGDAPFAP